MIKINETQLSTSTLIELNNLNKKIPLYKKILTNYNSIKFYNKCSHCYSKDLRYLDRTYYRNKNEMTDKTRNECKNIINNSTGNNHYYCADCGLVHSYYISDY